jgi:hypothetical protein
MPVCAWATDYRYGLAGEGGGGGGGVKRAFYGWASLSARQRSINFRLLKRVEFTLRSTNRVEVDALSRQKKPWTVSSDLEFRPQEGESCLDERPLSKTASKVESTSLPTEQMYILKYETNRTLSYFSDLKNIHVVYVHTFLHFIASAVLESLIEKAVTPLRPFFNEFSRLQKSLLLREKLAPNQC